MSVRLKSNVLHKWEPERPEEKETGFQTQRTGEAQMDGLVVCVTGGGVRATVGTDRW